MVGWLVRYFIRRFESFNPAILGSLISVVLGGAAIRFLESDPNVWWFYPIGLLLGFVLYSLVVWLLVGQRGYGALFGSKRKP